MDRRLSQERGMTRIVALCLLALVVALILWPPPAGAEPRATGDMGVVVERASGTLLIVDRSEREIGRAHV